MSSSLATQAVSSHPSLAEVSEAVALEARRGLTAAPKTLSPWLFYDKAGSRLFEQITELPEYYLTRTERSLFQAHADEMLALAAGEPSQASAQVSARPLKLIELGAGTAAKTGILLRAAVRRQGSVLYQPVDVSATALDEAAENIQAHIPGVAVRAQVADYTREALRLEQPRTRTLALYIGSSIGNFAPSEAGNVLANLRSQLRPGDALLLGTDLAPGPHKSVDDLLHAYDDAAGVTAAFNRNVLVRLNRDLGANFDLAAFLHRAIWNPDQSRIEMHLVSTRAQQAHIPANSSGPALTLDFAAGESIHTENSYKFTEASIKTLLAASGFQPQRFWQDERGLFAVTLAVAV